MRILITGATGAVGKKLCLELDRFNYFVRILTRKPHENASVETKIDYITGKLEDMDSLDKSTCDIDTVVHLAAITHTNNSALYYQINTIGTKNLVQSCEKNSVKNFIFISTRVACIEGGAYAHSKLLAEESVKSSCLNWVILRPAEIYGASDKEAVTKLINIIKKNKFVPVVGNGQYLLSPVCIDDIIVCIVRILEKNLYLKKTYILAGPEEFTFIQLTDKISETLNVKRIKVFIPIYLLKLLAYLFYIIKNNTIVMDQIPRLLCFKSCDISLARKELGFYPRGIVDYIRKSEIINQ